MRARNIKPGFFRNAELVDLPIETRMLFIGLWTMADREGRLRDRPNQIKMEIFPSDNFDVNDMLMQLQSSNFIVRYEADDTKYIEIGNFSKHQTPHHKEAPSEIPPPLHRNWRVETVIHHPVISKAVRTKIMSRDEACCVHCGSEKDLCIGHVVPLTSGGTNSPDNLKVVCRSCNMKKQSVTSFNPQRKQEELPVSYSDYSMQEVKRFDEVKKTSQVKPDLTELAIPDFLQGKIKNEKVRVIEPVEKEQVETLATYGLLSVTEEELAIQQFIKKEKLATIEKKKTVFETLLEKEKGKEAPTAVDTSKQNTPTVSNSLKVIDKPVLPNDYLTPTGRIKKKYSQINEEPFELPDWINRKHWDVWIANRNNKRVASSAQYKQLAVDKLTQWKELGYDYAKALETSAVSGWQGLFCDEEKQKKGGGFVNQQTAIINKNNDVVARALEKLKAGGSFMSFGSNQPFAMPLAENKGDVNELEGEANVVETVETKLETREERAQKWINSALGKKS